MIIKRYITRQILLNVAAITLTLLLISLLARALTFLVRASQGKLDAQVISLLMLYRVPEYLQLILPLALLLGIMLALGRMYADSEMTVIAASGIGKQHLTRMVLIPTACVVIMSTVMTQVLTPWGLSRSNVLIDSQSHLNEFDVLVPGIFQNMSSGRRMTYAQDRNNLVLENVFMYEQAGTTIINAQQAELIESGNGKRFVLLKNGSLNEALDATPYFTVTRFREFGINVPRETTTITVPHDSESLSTLSLLGSSNREDAAELHWRLSLLAILPILSLLAVPFSKVSPREGMFARLVPAILLYLLYFGLLLAVKNLLTAESRFPSWLLWGVHGPFLYVGLQGMRD